MRVVFMGTPQIAADCLSRLIADGFDLVGVYTKPDMPKNRGMKLAMSEVKEVALAAGLPVYQPATFRDDAAVEELRALRPDVIAVVAYGKILPQRVLDIPKLGCINIHTSILPALRGSAPAQWAILNGLDETGVTAMYLSAGMDEGDIIEIRKTPIEPLENSTALLRGWPPSVRRCCPIHCMPSRRVRLPAHRRIRPKQRWPRCSRRSFRPSTGRSLSGTSSIRCAALIRGPSPRRT